MMIERKALICDGSDIKVLKGKGRVCSDNSKFGTGAEVNHVIDLALCSNDNGRIWCCSNGVNIF